MSAGMSAADAAEAKRLAKDKATAAALEAATKADAASQMQKDAAAAAEAEKGPEGGEGADELWSADQQKGLEAGLAANPASMEKNERWTAIAKGVEGKSKKQCIERFKFLRSKLAASKK